MVGGFAHTSKPTKYWFKGHDTLRLRATPPDQGRWYPVFELSNIRLLWCAIIHYNLGVVAKNIEFKWTIDGVPFLGSALINESTAYWVYRATAPSEGGTAGLLVDSTRRNAGYNTDIRGMKIKIEVRMTSIPEADEDMICDCVIETLEAVE